MALDYLEIKDFPSELTPILKGGGEVVSWWRNGELAERKRDALLVATNAGAYAVGLGADSEWFGPTPIGSTGDGTICDELEIKISELAPVDDGTVNAINPLLVIQIAQLIYQLIRSLKS